MIASHVGDSLDDAMPEILMWVSYEFSWDLWCKMDFSSYPVDTQVRESLVRKGSVGLNIETISLKCPDM